MIVLGGSRLTNPEPSLVPRQLCLPSCALTREPGKRALWVWVSKLKLDPYIGCMI